MFTKIILAGGSGYLGKVLADYYKDKAKEIVIFSRSEADTGRPGCRIVKWDAESRGGWEAELDNADMVINLCGKNVNCRYTAKNRAEIFRSRLVPTTLLGEAIAGASRPPKLWINIASATVYRHAEDRLQDEETGEVGSGFSVDVCTAWEENFWKTETPQTQKLVLRVGLVLGRADGVFPRLKRLVATGLGGHQGTGNQLVSWIHEQDFARVTEWVFGQQKRADVYNCTAPGAVSNRKLMQLIRQTYGIPVGLPTPQWMLEIGAKLIGTETELVLKSRWVYPRRLLGEGFTFSFPEAEHAIHEIMSTRT
ncbi:TIGR01777 family oxidoreductase [Flavisolibacter nicotianae]|uniref:TIGR01777 family oxidoreductase n=1 Tax=Flavisolibacter nicotianae TaxID=2364882 RepID=UPI000EAC70A4|nr:TIGR01777 family oxidoreductase [Flavisolibacter nicotianae]